MKKFPCTKCGLCCRHIESVAANAKAVGLDFPYAIKPGTAGECEMLDGDLCRIYATRPVVCDVGKFKQATVFKDIPRREWFQMNAVICNDMQAKAGVAKKFRVKICR